jgi:hypothetical protein
MRASEKEWRVSTNDEGYRHNTEEHTRLRHEGKAWRHWGPYLSERAWGTVREDYSATGEAWDFFPHDHARSRVYRWNEDGLAGLCDDQQHLCFALALWNGQDPILKERLFGLAGPEGNHGEDVKEYYYYLDSTPSHSYVRMLYKYPQAAFPYGELVSVNQQRGKQEPEYELVDTGVFTENRYFDVFVEYAKAGPTDILVRISAVNRGPAPAPLHVLPTLWFRNTWSWGRHGAQPRLLAGRQGRAAVRTVQAEHPILHTYTLYCEGADDVLVTENETNTQRLFGIANAGPYVKDAFHTYLIEGRADAVNPEGVGTKAAALYRRTVAPGETLTLRLRLTSGSDSSPFTGFDATFARRQQEAEAFYDAIEPPSLDADHRLVLRQAFASMLWSKQFYHFDVDHWLQGDPASPPPPAQRKWGRNHDWFHLDSADIFSMPDKWEYPWFAAWDLAFHCLPLALVDPEFAKGQLELLLDEHYQHPNGAVPAYEWAFADVNPPVLAFSAIRIFVLDRQQRGKADFDFLDRVFHKLLLNFTWWVNRKDAEDNNIFEGGFLGLDNIGIFDRSAPLPTGGFIQQSDGTSWMASYCASMMTISFLLAKVDPSYEDMAIKFYEHFLYIAGAMNNAGGDGVSLWDEEDGFFYDVLRLPDGTRRPLKVRSLVGLTPLFAVATLDPEQLSDFKEFFRHVERFLERRHDLAKLVPSAHWTKPHGGRPRQLALVTERQLRSVLHRLLDPEEFLSDYGIRALSRYHLEHPYRLDVGHYTYTVQYEPAESHTGMFGGNSNWRGPIWMPMNYMLIDALRRFYSFYGDDFTVECPTGSGQLMTLHEVGEELSRRLMRIFLRDEQGNRPFNGSNTYFQQDPHWRDCILFHEYFHGDSGAGVGASHQTGWTGLVANLLEHKGGRGLVHDAYLMALMALEERQAALAGHRR